MLNICQCGASASYKHPATCPFPLYRGDKEQVARWHAAAQTTTTTPVGAGPHAPVEAAQEVKRRLQESWPTQWEAIWAEFFKELGHLYQEGGKWREFPAAVLAAL